MFIVILVISTVLIGLALVGLGISMLFKKGGKFPETHIGKSKAMKERGITCANTTDYNERKNYRPIEILEE